MIESIYTAKDGAAAVAAANEILTYDTSKNTEVRLTLYARVYDKFGEKVFSFTPRVANIWYDYFGEPHVKLAAITLAAAQDESFPCDRKWERRLSFTKELLTKHPPESIEYVLKEALSNFYDFRRLANDYGHIDRLMVKYNPISENLTPVTGIVPVEEYVPGEDAEEHESWLNLVRKGN